MSEKPEKIRDLPPKRQQKVREIRRKIEKNPSVVEGKSTHPKTIGSLLLDVEPD